MFLLLLLKVKTNCKMSQQKDFSYTQFNTRIDSSTRIFEVILWLCFYWIQLWGFSSTVLIHTHLLQFWNNFCILGFFLVLFFLVIFFPRVLLIIYFLMFLFSLVIETLICVWTGDDILSSSQTLMFLNVYPPKSFGNMLWW